MTQPVQDEHPVPIIDASRCTSCGLCVAVCPTCALMMKGAIAIVPDPQACAYTGHCERICPEQAISRPFQIVFSPKEETT